MKRNLFIVVLALLMVVFMAATVWAATLTPQEITKSGIIVTPVTITDTTHTFANDGNQFIYIANASGDTIAYTVTIPGTIGGYNIEDVSGTVADGVTKYVGPFNPTYSNDSSGNVDFATNTATSVTLAVLELN